MRHRITLVFIAFCFLALSSCNKNKTNIATSQQKISVVCTMFPQYDWCREILGIGNVNTSVYTGTGAGEISSQTGNLGELVSDTGGSGTSDFELTLLMNKGADLHNYQPTVSDLVKIQNADILIYVGGESDGWIRDALKSAKKEIHMVSLMETLDVHFLREENEVNSEYLIVNSEDAKKDSVILKSDMTVNEIEYDEHVWLSVRNAEFFVRKICSVICDVAGNKDFYWANANQYIEGLRKLDRDFGVVTGKILSAKSDGQIESVVSNGTDVSAGGRLTILVADRFPFRYLVDDYDIKYFAAFPGCSAESEASFQTIVFLAGKVKEYNLPVVYVLENSDGKIAKSVIQNSGVDAKIERLNSLQSITEKDIAAGASYISLMLSNLYALSLSD